MYAKVWYVDGGLAPISLCNHQLVLSIAEAKCRAVMSKNPAKISLGFESEYTILSGSSFARSSKIAGTVRRPTIVSDAIPFGGEEVFCTGVDR
jgi:hypothetical protein